MASPDSAVQHGPTVYRVPEYAPADVPLSDLIDAGGQLRLNPDVDARGYFTVQLYKGRVRLQARGHVGLIPLNNRVVIDVVPRAPVANLSRLLRISRHIPDALVSERAYGRDETWNESLLDVYALTLATRIEHIASAGLLREYERREEVTSFPRGRILEGPTVVRLNARGVEHAVVASWFERTVDNPCNRCLKYALWFIAGRFVRLKSLQRERRRLHQSLNALYALFDGVQLDHTLSFLKDGLVHGNRPLPSLRQYYRPALDVATSIIREHAVDLEIQRAAVELPSLVLDMNKVFENYLRNTLHVYALEHNWATRVLDGNSEGKKLLFDSAPSEDATPDIVLRMPAPPEYLAIIEVKNVPVVGSSKRDAIEQAVTYAASYRCDRVVLAHPRHEDQGFSGLRVLGRLGDLTVYQYVFDLAAEQLDLEDQRFGEAIGSIAAPV